jgi:hypothetical protein
MAGSLPDASRTLLTCDHLVRWKGDPYRSEASISSHENLSDVQKIGEAWVGSALGDDWMREYNLSLSLSQPDLRGSMRFAGVSMRHAQSVAERFFDTLQTCVQRGPGYVLGADVEIPVIGSPEGHDYRGYRIVPQDDAHGGFVLSGVPRKVAMNVSIGLNHLVGLANRDVEVSLEWAERRAG